VYQFSRKKARKIKKGVILYMHYYACPYCSPHPGSHLVETVMGEIKCRYDNEKGCQEKHQCKKIMQCKRCDSAFAITKKFLKDQKRKIKDG
jgi:hypothetical protein